MPQTPEELLKVCEDRLSDQYNVYPFDGCTGLAPTGEPYITYTCQGVKQEGIADSNYGSTPMEAVENYMTKLASLFFFGRFPKHRIFWRTRPTIREFEEEYNIWSRFLISDKPYFLPSVEPEID